MLLYSEGLFSSRVYEFVERFIQGELSVDAPATVAGDTAHFPRRTNSAQSGAGFRRTPEYRANIFATRTAGEISSDAGVSEQRTSRH